jgi:hypothetical protein
MQNGIKQSSLKNACLAAVLFILLLSLALWTSCGDTFRPVANPVPGPIPDPRNFHLAVVISQNALGNPGSGMQIDVSGDSSVGVVNAGQQPIHAALTTQGTRVFVANTDGTVTTFTPASTFGSIGTVTTLSLPTGLLPQFLNTAETNNMYAVATNNGFSACTNSVVVAISTTTGAVAKTACVGPDPGLTRRFLTETPDGRKLYTVNGDGTISSINTVDFSTNPPISPAALNSALTTPVSVVASLDSSQVFVLDASGLIWTIDTFTDLPAAFTTNAATVGANFMFLEPTRNRLYVTNSILNTVSIFDAGVQVPQAPQVIAAPLALPANTAPVMMAALPNGARVYVLSSNSSNRAVVTGIGTLNNTINSTVALPATTVNPGAVAQCQTARFPQSIAASGDSNRLYVPDCFAGSTSIIDTRSNLRVLSLNSPTSAYSPIGSAKFPPPQNPVWVVAGP